MAKSEWIEHPSFLIIINNGFKKNLNRLRKNKSDEQSFLSQVSEERFEYYILNCSQYLLYFAKFILWYLNNSNKYL